MDNTAAFKAQSSRSQQSQLAALRRIASLAQLSTGSDAALVILFDEIRAGAGLFEDFRQPEIELILNLCSETVSYPNIHLIDDVANQFDGKRDFDFRKVSYVGAFAGAPIWVSGVRIGTLAVVSEQTRALDSFEQKILIDLAALAAGQIESNRQLEDSQRKHYRAQQIFQEVSDGVITVNEFGHIRRMNRAAERIFRGDAESIRGERISLDPRDGIALKQMSEDAKTMPPDFQHFLGVSQTIAGRDSDGRPLTLELSVARVAMNDENAYVLTVRDITELHEIQLLLQQHAFIVEKTESAVLVTDARNQVEWCNGGFEATSGFLKADIRGLCPKDVLWDAENDPDTITQVERAIANKESYKTEMMWRRSNGQPFWVAVEAHPICNLKGELVKYVALGFDITERKRSAKMKTDFVSMVSHELRTPLTVVAGTLEAMIDGIAGPMPELADELLIMGKRNCTSLSTLIDDLLDVNQLELGVVKLNSREFEVSQLIVDVFESMSSIAEESGLHLKVIPNRRPATLFSDPDRINQVMTNLVGNALKFSPVDTTVSLGYEFIDDFVRVSVKDQGPGINYEFKDKLFEMFTRDPSVEASGKEGFGLGLCISKGLMDRMGGKIGFDSLPEGGSKFYFDMPLLRKNRPTDLPGAQQHNDSLLSSEA